MANLSEYEINERYLGEKLFKLTPNIKEYQFSSGRIAYDVIITITDEIRICGEIKVRGFNINKYNTYILEVMKLKCLINRANETKCSKVYYINFFPNDKNPSNVDFIIFNLTPRLKEWKDNPPKVEKKYMNRMTCVSRVDKMEKDVIMLSYNGDLDCKGTLVLG